MVLKKGFSAYFFIRKPVRIFMKREKILKVFVLLELMLLAGFSSVYFYGKDNKILLLSKSHPLWQALTHNMQPYSCRRFVNKRLFFTIPYLPVFVQYQHLTFWNPAYWPWQRRPKDQIFYIQSEISKKNITIGSDIINFFWNRHATIIIFSTYYPFV